MNEHDLIQALDRLTKAVCNLHSIMNALFEVLAGSESFLPSENIISPNTGRFDSDYIQVRLNSDEVGK